MMEGKDAMQHIHAFFLKKSKLSVLMIVLLLVAVLGWLDYHTGFEISFSFFYLGPIAIATWYINKKTGYLITILSISVWLATNWAAGETYTHEIIRFWNASVRFILFAAIIWLLEEFKRALNHEHLLARTDYLTGIANSREFHQQAHLELLRACRSKQPLTIAYIDVDEFKQINDQFGHLEGDRILRLIAQTILASIRKTDFTARIGGDEFTVLLPNTEQDSAKIIMDRMNKELTEKMKTSASHATFSMGVVTFVSPPVSVDELLRQSDAAMYQVKMSGKNDVAFIHLTATSIDQPN